MKLSDLDKALQTYIVQPADFETWASVLEERVVPWIREQANKALWDMVLFVSQRMGVVKPKLSRGKFAQLVIVACPSLRGESPESLKASMEKLKGFSARRKRDFKSLPDTEECRELRRLYEKVAELLRLDGNAIVLNKQPDGSVASRMETTLRKILQENEHAPYNRMRIGRIYKHDEEHRIQPSLSLETYSSDTFLQQERPSFVLAYECMDRQVTRDDVRRLWYDYSTFHGVKLVIVSSVGFTTEVISSAGNNNIGLIRIQPDGELSPVLPRSMNDYLIRDRQMQELAGGKMEGQLLIHDFSRFHSLGVWLKTMGFTIAPHSTPRVPYHTEAEIIQITDRLHSKLWLHREFEVRGMDKLAAEEHLAIQWGYLPEGQQGRIDTGKGEITLNFSIRNDAHLSRFTLAHELGHYYLHAKVLKEYFSSFGETDHSLNGKYDEGDDMRWLEYQANLFASNLLMPEHHVRTLADRIFDERERRIGYLWYDDQPVNRSRYNYVIGNMSAAMNVSKAAVKLRMKKLGLLREGTTSKRVREILKKR